MAPIRLGLHRIRQQARLAPGRLSRSLKANGLGDQAFLSQVHRFERLLAKLLAAAMIVVLVVATGELVITLINQLLGGSSHWLGNDMTRFLDQILALLIALEVLQNLTAYLRDNVVQIELVLVTALTAVSRKLIVMPPGVHKDPGDLFGLGFAAVALAAAYWLVRQSHVKRRPSRTVPTTGSPDQDPSPRRDGAGGE